MSVLMIVQNGQRTIEPALASLLLQTHRDWECVIVDDASTDSTPLILSRLGDPRFKVYRSDTPLGRGAARQRALSLSQGDYVSFLDADDVYLPQKLQRQVKVLDSDETLVATVTGLLLFSDGGEAPMGEMKGYLPAGRRTILPRLTHLRLPFPAIMFRKSQAEGLQYRTDYARAEDQEFFTNLLRGRDILITDDHLYCYRWRFSANDVLAGLAQTEKMYLQHLSREPVWSSLLYLYTRIKRLLYLGLLRLGCWEALKWLKYRGTSARKAADFSLHLGRCRSLDLFAAAVADSRP